MERSSEVRDALEPLCDRGYKLLTGRTRGGVIARVVDSKEVEVGSTFFILRN